jgi:hypothetical protein
MKRKFFHSHQDILEYQNVEPAPVNIIVAAACANMKVEVCSND